MSGVGLGGVGWGGVNGFCGRRMAHVRVLYMCDQTEDK